MWIATPRSPLLEMQSVKVLFLRNFCEILNHLIRETLFIKLVILYIFFFFLLLFFIMKLNQKIKKLKKKKSLTPKPTTKQLNKLKLSHNQTVFKYFWTLYFIISYFFNPQNSRWWWLIPKFPFPHFPNKFSPP